MLKRHDVPPIADARELLESADAIGADMNQLPETAAVGAGITLNVSEMIARLKQAAWQRRENRLRNGHLPVLPTPPDGSQGQDAP